MINWLKTNQRWALIGGLLIWVLMFALGRWTAPTKTITKIQTVEVEKKVTDVKDRTVVVEVVKPDGTRTITTKKDIDTNVKESSKTNTNNETIVSKGTSPLIVSALVGINMLSPSSIILGAHVSKQLLGPVHTGIFGMSNGSVGMSLGLQF